MSKLADIWTEAKALPPSKHAKVLTHDALPLVTKASVEVSDYFESMNDDTKNREWLRLTGEAQSAILDLITYIKKNTKD
jgi:hypothetical protein